MTLNVSVSSPRVSVTVWPYEGGRIDLNSQLLAVETSHSIGDAAATWAITLRSERDAQGRTWDKRIRGQDYIEIYMGRDIAAGGPVPVVMRGFVINSRETMQVQERSVNRVVICNGQNYGKVLLKRQLVFASEIDPLTFLAPDLAVGKKVSEIISGYGGLLSPRTFMTQVISTLLDDPIVGAKFRNSRVPYLDMKVDIPDGHKLFLPNSPATAGSIWNWLQQWKGDPFNEMFIRDDVDMPRLYWRMSPYKDKYGRVARAGAMNEAPAVIPLSDIIAPDIGTSDAEAMCYFFTVPAFYSLMAAEQYFIETPPTSTGGDIAPFNGAPTSGPYGTNPILRRDIFERYGFQALRTQYPLTPGLLEQNDRDLDPTAQPEMISATRELNSWLHQVYSWKPAMESGTLHLKGNPNIRVGTYLQIKEQRREFYVESVSHNFNVANDPSYTTTVGVTRGLWLENSPYPEMTWL